MADKLLTKFDWPSAFVRTAVEKIRRYSRIVSITNSLDVISRDPDDNAVLECAVVGGANYIVTGDKRHLLPLGSYQGIAIITAADFLARVAPR